MSKSAVRLMLLVIVLQLAACAGAFVEPRPPRSDPLTGILPTLPPPRAAESVIASPQAKRLGMIVSDSTEKQLGWLQAMNERQKNNIVMSDLADYWDPKNMASLVIDGLKRRFADVVLVDDMNDVRARRFDYAVVVDIGTDFIVHGSGDTENRYDVRTDFIDPAGRLVGSAQGAGGKRHRWFDLCSLFPSFDCVRRYSKVQYGDALNNAITAWEADLGKMVR